jgi:RNA 3'-terminal phosphate cyclase (ATP)
MLAIDGSAGEGGGQVLRTSLALSLATGRPFRIDAIRAGRPRPGLLRQHLTCVRAACAIAGADARGAELGSTSLELRPGRVRAGDYAFAVGSAGSAALVLQTVLVPLALADGPSTVRVQGGTHNPAAPPFEFLERAYVPQLRRMGYRVEIELVRHGFFPAGGGELVVRIEPPGPAARPLELLARGVVRERRGDVLIAHLPWRIAEVEAAQLAHGIDVDPGLVRAVGVSDSAGPGNAISCTLSYDSVAEVCTAFGRKGLPAKRVVSDVVRQVRRYLASRAPVGEHLADQLMVPLALGAGGRFRASAWSSHARTNAATLAAFLGDVCAVDETDVENGGVLVDVAARRT